MSRFSSLLQSIHDRLNAPEPARSRILLEISADLEDAYDYYREQGKSEQEATQLAQEHFILDDAAIRELSTLHQPLMKKWLDTFSTQFQKTWERALVLVVLIAIALSTGITLANSFFWQHSSIFVRPVLAVGIVGIVNFIIRFFQLFIFKKYDLKTLRPGINSIAYFGVFSLALGFTGYFYEVMLYGIDSIFPGSRLIAVIISAIQPTDQVGNIFQALLSSTTVMMSSLLTSLLLGLCWYILAAKFAHIEQTQAKALLNS